MAFSDVKADKKKRDTGFFAHPSIFKLYVDDVFQQQHSYQSFPGSYRMISS